MSASLEKLKPSRLKRELIPFIIISVVTISSFIYFSYQDSTGSIIYSPEIPTINIEISDEISNFSQQCFIKFEPISFEFMQTNWANRYLAASIRRRNADGGFSFELYQNENLFDIRNDDDWLLLPPGNNLDALRGKMAFDIYNMLRENGSNYRLPNSKLAEVYINGKYQGFYLLSERIDRKMMNLNQENFVNIEENDMIFKASNWEGDFYTIPNTTDSQWEQIFPNAINFSHVPLYLTQYIHNTSEEDFFNEDNGIFTIFDKNSIIDNLLFGLFIGHEIIEGSSFYLIRNHDIDPGIFILPWKFEQSFGFYKHGAIPLDLWLNGEKNEINSVVWSKLYYRLLFPKNSSINHKLITEIKDRWNYIRTYLWKSDKIISYFNNLYSLIQNTILRTSNNDDLVLDFAEDVRNWLVIRGNLLDKIFNEQDTIFIDDLESPYRANSEVFGFSSPRARRHYFKSSPLFTTQEIHEVSIVIQSDYFEDMILRKFDEHRWNERLYMPSNISIDDYSIDNVGFRVRENYNRNYPKDSFKLKFSETEFYIGNNIYKNIPENKDRRFLGLRRLNLRAAPIDFSFMNEVAGYEIYKILGMPHTRISWTKLYITEINENGNIVKPKEYKGLYLLTEDIDKTFLNYNFKNPEGNLYKTTDLIANLEYQENLKAYLTWDNRRVYELRTNEEQDDYSDLERFAYAINYNWSNFQETTNMDLIARYFAASNFQGNWDDYVFLPHNYFLYSDPNFGFVFIPWDIEQNLNIGTDFSIIGFEQPYSPDFRYAPLLSGYERWFDGISEWAGISPDPRPLWDNLINDSDFVDAYLNAHGKIVNNSTNLIEQIEEYFNFIKPAVLEPFSFTDPYIYLEWYPTQVDVGWFNYDKTRVLNFLAVRTQYVKDQLP